MERFVVIGLGAFGGPLARRLHGRGAEVLGIDTNERLVEELQNDVTRAVVADATDRETLEALGVADFGTAIVAIGENREANILISAVLREMGVPRIVGRATGSLHARILTAIGVHKVVSPEEDYGLQLADNLSSTFALERFPLAEGIQLGEFIAHPLMVGRSLRQLDLRGRFQVNVVALQRRRRIVDAEGEVQETMDVSSLPEPDQVLKEGDVLIMIGSAESLDAVARAFEG